MLSPARRLVLLALLCAPAGPCLGAAAERAATCEADGTGAGPSLAASAAGDGSLALSDGHRFVPAGIVVPTVLRPDPELASRAAAATAGVLDGRFLVLGTTTPDRHGRLVGAARLSGRAPEDASTPLVLALLEAGAGYADPRGAATCADRLLAAEAEARRARRGIFATDGAIVAASDDVAAGLNAGLVTVAEGRVSAAGATREKAYLNFGPRWRDDFTVILSAKDFATILGDDRDLAMLRGTRVRVRGVVREEGGPVMVIRSPNEISVLSDPHAADAGKGEVR